MENMTISPNFMNHAGISARVSFQFTVRGTEQTGVSYVTRNIPEGADVMVEARKACKILCKRAVAETAELCAIVAPGRWYDGQRVCGSAGGFGRDAGRAGGETGKRHPHGAALGE
jgi:hypothetical protein